MSMIPTVGRIVYYKALNGETYPAIVVRVHDESTLGLNVFYPSSSANAYIAHVEQGDDLGTWDWMPYQKQQAQKEGK